MQQDRYTLILLPLQVSDVMDPFMQPLIDGNVIGDGFGEVSGRDWWVPIGRLGSRGMAQGY